MSREISRAESWERVYEAFQQVNFSAFDYNTVKSSLVEYLKIYHPEKFNDYIESSELIAILELFAYIAELLSYRADMNAHENFITVAQRKQSILRLATMLSYNPSRNIPARGLVKLTSVKTTEPVFDSNGNNLANVKIIWNDPNNAQWKEQFFLVINQVLQQSFGTVVPNDRVQIDDVVFELYTLNNNDLINGVFPYTASADGSSHTMELVPVTLDENGPAERRPGVSNTFSLLYGSDGLGDSSPTTGFFMFTKQGTLKKETTTFDGITPNQLFEPSTENVNNTDVWLNQVDPATGDIFTEQVSDGLGRVVGVQGEWTQISNTGVHNVIFNTDPNRNKYQIETLEDDKIRIIFGDGEFAEIPRGTFDLWTRQSSSELITIPRNAIDNATASFNYQDEISQPRTFNFTFSAISTFTNASPSESLERIRQSAPSVYYTQNRMVNGQDYNTFPLQDPTILKLRTINRTFAGDSKYLVWHDPSEYYEDVKLFGNDLVLFYRTDVLPIATTNQSTITTVIRSNIQPVLSDVQLVTYHASNGIPLPARVFSAAEIAQIETTYNTAVANNSFPISMVYSLNSTTMINEWTAYANDGTIPSNAIVSFVIEWDNGVWDITYNATRIVIESPTTRFWFNNEGNTTLLSETLTTQRDLITLLQANVNRDRDGILTEDIPLQIVGGEIRTISPNIAQANINQLHVMPPDENSDGIPDDLELASLIDRRVASTDIALGLKTVPFEYLISLEELDVYAIDGAGAETRLERGVDYYEREPVSGTDITNALLAVTHAKLPSTEITLNSIPVGTVSLQYRELDYVYFQRQVVDNVTVFTPLADTPAVAGAWFDDPNKNTPNATYRRNRGRSGMNFAWQHRSPRGNLIDPSPTNINDMFVVTRGYYDALKDWTRGIGAEPTSPTALQLRNDYKDILENKMISDTVVIHPGRFKVLFGPLAVPELQATIKVIRSSASSMTDNEIKLAIVEAVRNFFELEFWEFGETFNFSELASVIHGVLVNEVSSVVLVPTNGTNSFGDLLQVVPREDEFFIPNITTDQVELVDFLNPQTLRQCGD
jgi:hypothetical protein